MASNTLHLEKSTGHTKKRILLGLLPFWTPMIPPQGISQLKVFLEKHGYSVKTIDANVEPQFKEIYKRWFNAIMKFVPESNWGNLYNIGHDVLRNHMMAHFNWSNGVGDEKKYNNLVKMLVYNTYFWSLDEEQVIELNAIIGQFYVELEQYILDRIEKERPDVFGLTIHLGTLCSSLFALKLAKERYPRTMTVVGGSIFAGELPVTSPDFELLLKQAPYIDKLIIGEGENLFLRLLEGELPGSQRVFTLEDIDGLKLDIAAIDLPDLSDFDLDLYPYDAAYVSKSCPHQCRFCNVAGFFGDYRQKSVKQAADYFVESYRRHGFQVFHMLDSLVNPFITDLANELIERDISLYYDAYMRVSDEVCDTEKTLLWRRGGLYRVRLGIETGSQRLLDLMDKDITVEQSKAAIASLAHAGIKTTTYVVVGFPGETEDDFLQTLDFIEEMKNDIWQMECNPFYYFYTGQNWGDHWADKRKLLYPEYAREMLIAQTWILDCEPDREERFRRMFRLVQHCKRLGIPNPYTWEEIYQADKRWQSLHENAVPTLMEFEDREVYIEENKTIKRLIPAANTLRDESDFTF